MTALRAQLAIRLSRLKMATEGTKSAEGYGADALVRAWGARLRMAFVARRRIQFAPRPEPARL